MYHTILLPQVRVSWAAPYGSPVPSRLKKLYTWSLLKYIFLELSCIMNVVYLLLRLWLMQILSRKQREIIKTPFFFIRKFSPKGFEAGKAYVQSGKLALWREGVRKTVGFKQKGSLVISREFQWRKNDVQVSDSGIVHEGMYLRGRINKTWEDPHQGRIQGHRGGMVGPFH